MRFFYLGNIETYSFGLLIHETKSWLSPKPLAWGPAKEERSSPPSYEPHRHFTNLYGMKNTGQMPANYSSFQSENNSSTFGQNNASIMFKITLQKSITQGSGKSICWICQKCAMRWEKKPGINTTFGKASLLFSAKPLLLLLKLLVIFLAYNCHFLCLALPSYLAPKNWWLWKYVKIRSGAV